MTRLRKLLSVSMDGPSTNGLFLSELSKKMDDELLPEILPVGSCVLHIVHRAAKDGYTASVHGRIVRDLNEVPPGTLVLAHARLIGGKGGFGSMLRAIGSQIEKTTNREMCRDLTGRRMRDVNMEKKLKDWLAQASDRQREEVERRLERRRRRRELLKNGPIAGHKFEDRQYHDQKREIAEQLESAVEEALRSLDKTPASSDAGPSQPKKQRRCFVSDEEEAQLLAEASDTSSSSSSDSEPEVSLPPPHSPAEQTEDVVLQDNSVNDETTPIAAKICEPCVDSVKVSSTAPFVLSDSTTPEDLEAAGLDRLKIELTDRGLKCGGTLAERAARLWTVKDLQSDQYPTALLAKPIKRKR